MKKIFIVLVAGIMIWGCGSSEEKKADKAGTPFAKQIARQQRAAASSTKAKDFIEDGIEHLQDAEVKAAIQSFDNAIRQNPWDPEPYLILSQTYMRLKNYLRAVDTLSAAERIAPDRGDIPYLLAICYGILGKQDLAAASAKKSIELFRASKDEEHFKKAIALLQGLLEAK